MTPRRLTFLEMLSAIIDRHRALVRHKIHCEQNCLTNSFHIQLSLNFNHQKRTIAKGDATIISIGLSKRCQKCLKKLEDVYYFKPNHFIVWPSCNWLATGNARFPSICLPYIITAYSCKHVVVVSPPTHNSQALVGSFWLVFQFSHTLSITSKKPCLLVQMQMKKRRNGNPKHFLVLK